MSPKNKSWVLSGKRPNGVENEIPVAKLLKNHDQLAINHIYLNYSQKAGGVVLNEENGMNPILQISAFLRAINASGPIIVICPRRSIIKWHFHLTNEAQYSIICVNNDNKNYLESGSQTARKTAFILDADNLNCIKDSDLISFAFAIVENIDLYANKAIVKRQINGNFNIGLTDRNFYQNWDQKLVWSVLNWAWPKFAGKLKIFPEIDDTNMENFADNYRFCWFRLTWAFCDSFQQPTDAAILKYNRKLEQYAVENDLGLVQGEISSKIGRKMQKRKRASKTQMADKMAAVSDSDEEGPVKPRKRTILKILSDSDSSDTEEIENKGEQMGLEEATNENGILTNFLRNKALSSTMSDAVEKVLNKIDIDSSVTDIEEDLSLEKIDTIDNKNIKDDIKDDDILLRFLRNKPLL